jgi:hypothetical protein
MNKNCTTEQQLECAKEISAMKAVLNHIVNNDLPHLRMMLWFILGTLILGGLMAIATKVFGV